MVSASQAKGSVALSLAVSIGYRRWLRPCRRPRSRRRDSSCGRAPVPVHSAHVGQVYRVHYQWHAYFGSDVKVFRTLSRGDGQHVGLERDPGIAILAPAWILDASVCQGFDLGEPVVSTEALYDLHSVLRHLGFRRRFQGDDSPMEAPNDASQIGFVATMIRTRFDGKITDGPAAP